MLQGLLAPEATSRQWPAERDRDLADHHLVDPVAVAGLLVALVVLEVAGLALAGPVQVVLALAAPVLVVLVLAGPVLVDLVLVAHRAPGHKARPGQASCKR